MFNASIHSKMTRLEYFKKGLILTLGLFILFLVYVNIISYGNIEANFFSIAPFFLIPLSWSIVMYKWTIKRLRDISQSKRIGLWMFVPVICLVVYLFLSCFRSCSGYKDDSDYEILEWNLKHKVDLINLNKLEKSVVDTKAFEEMQALKQMVMLREEVFKSNKA